MDADPPSVDDRSRRRANGPHRRRVEVGIRLAFPLSIAILAASAAILVAADESEWPMFALGLAGILAGRALGLPKHHLALVAVAVTVVGWPIAALSSPIPRVTTTIAHGLIAALLAAVIAGPVRQRWPVARAPLPTARWFIVPALVLAVGGAWELGEWGFDVLSGTDLAVAPVDSLVDLLADGVGAILGLALRDRARVNDPAVVRPPG